MLSLDEDRTVILASAGTITSAQFPASSEVRSGIIYDLRAAHSAAVKSQGVYVHYANGKEMLRLEMDAELIPQSVNTVSSSVIAVSIITILLVPNLVMVGLVAVSITSVMIIFLGFVAICGFRFDSIVGLTLLVGLGFAIDCNAHICLAYVTLPFITGQNKRERIIAAHYSVGVPLFQAGCSTLLGIAPAFFSSSMVLHNFMLLTACIIGIGMTHGLLIMPCLMTLCAPEPRSLGASFASPLPLPRKHATSSIKTVESSAISKLEGRTGSRGG